MILVIYNIVAKLTGIIQVPGYTSTVFSIWFVGGLIMMQLGVVGIYIGRIFDQVKGRPIFVVMDKINF
jgi:dolichol-phosphate mannosyltransferase